MNRRVGYREFPSIPIRGHAQTRLLSKKFCIWQPCNVRKISAQAAVQKRSAWSSGQMIQSSSGRGSYRKVLLETPVSRGCTWFSVLSVVVRHLLDSRYCESSLLGLFVPMVEDGQLYCSCLVFTSGWSRLHTCCTGVAILYRRLRVVW